MIQIVKLMCRDEIPDNDYMIISRMTKIFGVSCLEGFPEYLTFLYNTGLGSKNSQGFGMFEVVE